MGDAGSGLSYYFPDTGCGISFSSIFKTGIIICFRCFPPRAINLVLLVFFFVFLRINSIVLTWGEGCSHV